MQKAAFYVAKHGLLQARLPSFGKPPALSYIPVAVCLSLIQIQIPDKETVLRNTVIRPRGARTCLHRPCALSKDHGKKHLVERIDLRNGMRTMDYAEQIGLGCQAYELVVLD